MEEDYSFANVQIDGLHVKELWLETSVYLAMHQHS